MQGAYKIKVTGIAMIFISLIIFIGGIISISVFPKFFYEGGQGYLFSMWFVEPGFSLLLILFIIGIVLLIISKNVKNK